MRIGVTTFGGDGGKSGISRYIISLLRELPKLDPASEFEALVYANEKRLFVPDGSRVRTVCFPERLRNPLLNVAWHQFSLPGWSRRRRYDVLFLPAGNRRLPFKVDVPTVGTVHDFSTIHVKDKYDPVRSCYIKRMLPVFIRRLTHVLTDSESSKRDIVEYARVPEERITVAPLAANEEVFYPREKAAAQQRMRERYGLRPPYILYLSRIEHPGKNHVRLVRAFERMKTREDFPHQLVLAGSDWVRARVVRSAAAESRFASDIVFTGFAPHEDLPDLYNAADLFVFPSLYEGFGLPVLEAMCCGVPLACSNLSSMPEVAGDAALLFDPHSEESIADAMSRMLSDRELRQEHVRRGLARGRLFSWRRTASQTLAVLREAAEAGRSG